MKNFQNLQDGDEMTEFTKEYIRSVRMCSYLIEPPASEVIEHLCDEIERQAQRIIRLQTLIESLFVFLEKDRLVRAHANEMAEFIKEYRNIKARKNENKRDP